MTPHLTREELADLGLRAYGDNVMIDRSCRFYGAEHISLGGCVRIDAFCVLSASPAGISIGDYVHLSAGVTILGSGGVTIEDFAVVSVHTTVVSSTEANGGGITSPMVPAKYRMPTSAPVVIRRHAAIGASCVVLPGVEIGMGAAVGALTFVRHSVPEMTVVAGNPMRRVSRRRGKMLEFEAQLRQELERQRA